MPAISVIVPVYKVEPYLRRCVKSILNQSFQDFELILVDDGSPDNCPAICDEYAEKDRRVRVIHKSNRGVSSARNVGIDWVFANSDSRWLTFIDSDDWIHPEYLERLLESAIQNSSDISVCGYAETHGENPQVDKVSLAPKVWTVEKFYLSHRINVTVPWAKLYRKECFSSVRYPEDRKYEDEYTSYKVFFPCNTVPFINAPLYAYFQRPDSLVHQKRTENHYLDAAEAFEEQTLFFHERNLPTLRNVSARQALYKYKEAVKNGNKSRKPRLKRLLKAKIKFFRDDLDIRLSGNELVYEWVMPIRSTLSRRWRHIKKFIHRILR